MKTKVQRIHDLSAKKSRYFAPAFSLYCLLAHMQLSKNSRKTPGGADRDRTDDIQLAKLALSQLSYGPVSVGWWAWIDLNYRPHAYQACALTN